MNKAMFDRLVTSIKQAGKIHRGEMPPSRQFEVTPLDIKKMREDLHKSQPEFAAMIGVSVGTLRNWEQGRRRPIGPARALLTVVSKNPTAVLKALAA
jgi:putative transcriptional regulator